MDEVIPGIYRLPLPLLSTQPEDINTYLIRGNDGYLMVDTGWNIKESFGSLKKQLAEIGVDLKEISQIVVTHTHPDHYGLAGRIKKLSGTKISLHYLEKAFIDSRYRNMDNLLFHVAKWLRANGVPDSALYDLQMASAGMAKYVVPSMPDTTLYDGDIISTGLFTFEVLWTPGHSPGHICLYEPNKKVILTGDHILTTITPNVGLHPESSVNPLGDYIDSLHKVEQLEVELTLPGHEQPFAGLKTRIEEILRHHREREWHTLLAMGNECKTAYQIASGIPWMVELGGTDWEDMNPLNKRLAVLETIAHLEKMRTEGQVSKTIRDGIIYYKYKI